VTANDEFILETLVKHDVIDQETSAQALEMSYEERKSVVELLVEHEVCERDDIMSLLAEDLGMEVIELAKIKADIDPEVYPLVPKEIAQKFKIVPISNDPVNGLTVAVNDPLNMDPIDNLRILLNQHVEAVVAPLAEIEDVLEGYYGAGSAIDNMMEDLTQSGIALAGDTQTFDQDEDDDAPIIRLVSLLIIDAYRIKASDIHIEPMEKTLRVRYRIDGVLREVESPPKRLQAAIIVRLKIMSNMNIAEKRIPQDGRIKIPVMGKDLDLRVSLIPTTHGESIVMRLLDKDSLKLGLPDLGFFQDDQATFEKLISMADGIILVTGPTGSGKTTTLYSCLNEINKPDRKIITVEEPVEYQLDGINQVNVRCRAARHAASGAQHRHARRDSRQRDRDHRDQRLAHRSLGVLHPAHQRCPVRHHPSGRHRGETFPGRLIRSRHHGATPGSVHLPELQNRNRADRTRQDAARPLRRTSAQRAALQGRRLREVRRQRL